ncbi:MAG: hypothetical protein KDC55_10330, partial [Ignavibacteriae bacterium]|nr:hypothetical protein [Ignavibacteriota bacterium]
LLGCTLFNFSKRLKFLSKIMGNWWRYNFYYRNTAGYNDIYKEYELNFVNWMYVNFVCNLNKH